MLISLCLSFAHVEVRTVVAVLSSGCDPLRALWSAVQELDEAHCKCPFGAAGKEVGYDCPGTSHLEDLLC